MLTLFSISAFPEPRLQNVGPICLADSGSVAKLSRGGLNLGGAHLSILRDYIFEKPGPRMRQE